MNAIRHILCPSDFSAFTRRAFELSVALARQDAGRVRAIHVVPPSAPPRERGATAAAVSPAGEPEARLEDLARLVEPARAQGISADAAVFEGEVVGEILRQAREWPADVLVMGMRGHGPEEGWAVGSVTERVLRRAPCPLLAVPRPSEAPYAVGASPFKRILCPLDFSGPSERALEYAVALARAGGGELVLLHVLEWFPEEIPQGAVSVPEYRLDLSESARERLRAAVPEAARRVCAGEIVVAGRPHRQILRVAREREVDLIVLGVHGRRALDRSLSGATVCHVVREAGCPVLAVQAGEE